MLCLAGDTATCISHSTTPGPATPRDASILTPRSLRTRTPNGVQSNKCASVHCFLSKIASVMQTVAYVHTRVHPANYIWQSRDHHVEREFKFESLVSHQSVPPPYFCRHPERQCVMVLLNWRRAARRLHSRRSTRTRAPRKKALRNTSIAAGQLATQSYGVRMECLGAIHTSNHQV